MCEQQPQQLQLQGQEKWSSVRITDSKKSSMKVENHISVHSNLNLNGLLAQEHKQGIGKEVNNNIFIVCCSVLFCLMFLFQHICVCGLLSHKIFSQFSIYG